MGHLTKAFILTESFTSEAAAVKYLRRQGYGLTTTRRWRHNDPTHELTNDEARAITYLFEHYGYETLDYIVEGGIEDDLELTALVIVIPKNAVRPRDGWGT